MSKNNLTVVTGIWDLKRDQAGDGFKRPFQHYIDNFIKLLQVDVNMSIYIEQQYESIVWQNRKPENTRVYIKEVEEFKNRFDFYQDIQTLRKDEKWLSQAEWLRNSTQATLEYYNPMVMSKMFMMPLDLLQKTGKIWLKQKCHLRQNQCLQKHYCLALRVQKN